MHSTLCKKLYMHVCVCVCVCVCVWILCEKTAATVRLDQCGAVCPLLGLHFAQYVTFHLARKLAKEFFFHLLSFHCTASTPIFARREWVKMCKNGRHLSDSQSLQSQIKILLQVSTSVQILKIDNFDKHTHEHPKLQCLLILSVSASKQRTNSLVAIPNFIFESGAVFALLMKVG